MEHDPMLALCFKAREYGYKPYQLAEIDGKTVEIISFPFIMDDGNVAIKVREPNDPTTMRDAMVPMDQIQDLEGVI